MRRLLIPFTVSLFVSLSLFINVYAQPQTVYEKSGRTKTATYYEIISFYQQLDKLSSKLLLKTMGPSDAGVPLHLALYSNDGKFDPAQWRAQGKIILFIINGIHPGEPDGIDASMMMLRDLITNKRSLPNNVVLAVIPVYNIGGCLNRSPNYRVDQNGPEEFGSRGNSQNLDLNRDFIKNDSKEARSFAEIFHWLDPDIMIDNHVSNGADYQHVITLLTTQHNKLGGAAGRYLKQQMEPALYSLMREKKLDLVPYVNAFVDTPESGWPQFYDGPRYSSGYGALWQCFSFITETHMLKPYTQRVDATYAFMESMISFTTSSADSIKAIRKAARAEVLNQPTFSFRWKSDRSQFSTITFKGFEAGRKPSVISGAQRLYYDRSKPFTKEIRFYDTYVAQLELNRPKAYIIPQGWWRVTDLLRINKVEMRRFTSDTTLNVETYRITSYKSSPQPWEMHHLNSAVEVTKTNSVVTFRKGDWYVPMNQPAARFLAEVLEPQSDDSYFAWNFFDGILGQKEGYSPYVFEETAAVYLSEHPELQTALEEKRKSDSSFAKSGSAQLNFIYEKSKYMEPDYMKYPVYRVVN
ncbi:M14 family metallopeptidase [Pollutibacter soli]|uniref:M14 family metallopeptidase n=1 Tax=Pollutibacter soli TaxID=3034157 RepID=UPI0030138348